MVHGRGSRLHVRALTTIASVLSRSLLKMGPLENAKKIAACKAVDEYVKDNSVVGIGSGSTIIYAVLRLAERVKEEKLNIVCVPTSFQARQLILNNHLSLGDLETYPKLDCAIDGADEVDSEMNLIKGGGGCLLQEKIVASCADQLVIIADYTKNSQRLGEQYKKGIPVEVVPMAYTAIQRRIEDSYGGSVQIRMALAKAAINYVRCLVLVACLAQVVRSEKSRNKLQQQLLDVLTTDESLKVKRPFCNAFTGCGKKRSFQESSETQDLEASGSVRVPVPVYKALLRAATENIRSTMDRDANDYRLSDIPQVYLSGMPRKRLDVPATSFD